MSVNVNSVRTGIWTDYSKTTASNHLITLHSRNARILIAFLAVFVKVAGTRVWIIICFLIHQFRSDQNARDGLYHQRQALLRNTSDSATTLAYLTQMSFAWKSRAAETVRRQLPLILLATLHIATFAAASVLVSLVATAGTDSQVLLRGVETCNWWFGTDPSVAGLTRFWATQRPLLQESGAYAFQCYDIDGLSISNKQACKNTFAAPKISFTTQANAKCPFLDSKFCRPSSSGAIFLASEMINSNVHLGINAAPQDQINFRQFMTCAPLPDTPDTPYATDVSTTVFNNTTRAGHVTERSFYYSSDPDEATLVGVWTNSSSQLPYHFDNSWVASNVSDPTINDFVPADGLMPEQADLTIALLTNTVVYSGPSNDTLFRTPGRTISGSWYPRPFSVMGCATQWQFCNPVNDLCTAKGGWYDLGYSTPDDLGFKLWNDDGLTPLQHGTIYNIKVASQFAKLAHVVAALQSDALLAMRSTVLSDWHLSTQLPNNQTVMEMQYWFATMLAAMQDSFVALAFTPALKQYQAGVKNSSLADLCQRQKIRNPNYTTVSVAGLAVILAVGGACVILSFILPPMVGFVQRRFEYATYQRREWEADGLFHLQRSAFEGRGIANWSTKDSKIPITMPYEKFLLPLDRGRTLNGRISQENTRSVGGIRYTSLPREGGTAEV